MSDVISALRSTGLIQAGGGGLGGRTYEGRVVVSQDTAANLKADVTIQVEGSDLELGQALAAASLPVVLASDAAIAVSGEAADGAAVSGNPVLVAGSDGTNAVTVRTQDDGTVHTIPHTSPSQLETHQTSLTASFATLFRAAASTTFAVKQVTITCIDASASAGFFHLQSANSTSTDDTVFVCYMDGTLGNTQTFHLDFVVENDIYGYFAATYGHTALISAGAYYISVVSDIIP